MAVPARDTVAAVAPRAVGLAPALWSLCGVLLLAWSARRAFDAWSASISAAALLCAGAFGRFCMLAVNWHSLALVHTILVAAALVWIAGCVERMSARAVAAAAVALGALSALPTASDTLFPFWALVPLGGASAVVAGRLTPRARGKLALFTLTVIAVAILGGVLLAAVMRAGGITARSLPVGLVASNMLTHNLALLARSYAFLGGGRLSALGPTLEGVLLFASAVMVLCALLLALEQARRLLMRRALRRGMSPAALAYLSFWSLSLLCTTLVFILSDAPKDALSGRYLLAGYAALAALLPLAGAGVRSRRALTAGVCAFALIGTYQVLRAPFTVITSPEVAVRFPGPSAAAELKAFAASEHVSVGYGGYWDAEELTWATDFAVPVRPVRTCDPVTHTLCYPQLGMISSWYQPRSGIRSLLIVDSLDTSFNAVLHSKTPSSACPSPNATWATSARSSTRTTSHPGSTRRAATSRGLTPAERPPSSGHDVPARLQVRSCPGARRRLRGRDALAPRPRQHRAPARRPPHAGEDHRGRPARRDVRTADRRVRGRGGPLEDPAGGRGRLPVRTRLRARRRRHRRGDARRLRPPGQDPADRGGPGESP